MKISVALIVLGVSSVLLIQWKPESAVLASECREVSFENHLLGGDAYSREIGEGLWLRLSPLKDNWGWIIEVNPKGSDDDYAWPVNPPLRSGNSQYLGTGYGETVQQQLVHEHQIFFVLNREEYEHTKKLAYDALDSTESSAAQKYLGALPALRNGMILVKPYKYETTDKGKSVSWMDYSVTINAPARFHFASDFKAMNAACPPKRL